MDVVAGTALSAQAGIAAGLRRRAAKSDPRLRGDDEQTPAAKPAAPSPARAKLSYKDARELEQLPVRIETLETELARRTAAMNEPAFYQRDAAAIGEDNAALARLQVELDAAYARWAELDA